VGLKQIPDDGSIYTLRRRIPTRPTNRQEEPLDQEARVPKPGRFSAAPTWLDALITRLLPIVRLGH
jgi:hypothetical protein